MTNHAHYLAFLAAAMFAPSLALAAALTNPALELQGKGTQLYICTAVAGHAEWRVRAPDATLFDSAGRVVGRHFGGPTWQAADGSKIIGALLVTTPAPNPNSVPWLVFRAKSLYGAGMFSQVAYITMTETRGGTAPAQGCDNSHLGAESRSPYSATYTFFSSAS